jgi:hypothetical protein
MAMNNSASLGFRADSYLRGCASPKLRKPSIGDFEADDLHDKKFNVLEFEVVGLHQCQRELDGAVKRKKWAVQVVGVPGVKASQNAVLLVHAKASDDRAEISERSAKESALKAIKEGLLHKYTSKNVFYESLFLNVSPAVFVPNERVGEWVSSDTCKFISDEITDGADESQLLHLAADRIERSMSMLINSIADGVRDLGQGNDFELTSGDRFRDEVVRAILFRLPVGFYVEAGFIASLYRDFERAVSAQKIKHKRWTVSATQRGGIVLSLKEPEFAELESLPKNNGSVPWKKARAIRFSSLKEA